MKTGISLGIKFLAILTGIIVLLAISIVWFIGTSVRNHLVAEMQKRAEVIVQDVASESVNPILTKDIFALQTITIDHTGLHEDIFYIFITDPEGNILAHSFGAKFPTDLTKPSIVANVGAGRTTRLETNKGEVFDVSSPVLRGQAGIAHVGILGEPIEKKVSAILWRIIWIIAGILALGYVLAMYFVSFIVKPIRELIHVAEALGEGDLTQRAQVAAHDETGVLADAFNEMAEDLMHRTTSITNLNAEIAVRKQAERELAETRDYLEKLINYANAPIIVWAPDLRITKFNHAFEYLTGRSSEEVAGEELSILFPEDSRQQSLLEIERTVSGEYWESVEIPILRKDGSIRVALWNSANIYAEDGTTFIATIAQGADITERTHAEQERERLLKTLAAKNEELQSIVYVASHDLKSPLVNIQGFSGELSRTCEEFKAILEAESAPAALKEKLAPLMYEDVPEALRFIRAGTLKMQALLNGLLEVSRVGSAAFQIRALDMNSMMKHIIASMQYQINDSGAELTVDDLPDCIGDADHVNQVFSNLLTNAVKYLDPERKGEIHISGRVEDGESIYCVQDNGMGIAPQHQHKVFEIFHRLDPDRYEEGEGLGLTIALRILERHEGRIWVDSEPGKGSKFFVSLPAA